MHQRRHRYGLSSSKQCLIMAKSPNQEYELIPPDGGWGWMVVLGVAMNYISGQSVFSIFSVLFGDKLSSMGHQTTSAAVVLNINNALLNFSGLLTGPLLKRFSVRQVAVAGGLSLSAGLVLTSFANSILHIIITYSVLVGLGMGLVLSSGFLAIKSYFVSARARAVGVSMAGVTCGQMAMPHVVRLLLEAYGFSGTLLILGAIALHGPVGSLLLHPLGWHAERRPINCEQQPLTKPERTPDAEAARPRPLRKNPSMGSLASCHVGDLSEAVPERTCKRQCSILEDDEGLPQPDMSVSSEPESATCWRRVVAFMDLDLLRSGRYLNVAFATACVTTANVNFSLLLPLYVQHQVGLSLAAAAFCLTLMAAGDFAARLLVPPLAEHFKVAPRRTYFIGALLSVVTRSTFAVRSGGVELFVWVALCGVGRGAVVVYNNLCVAEVSPEDKLPAAIGLNMVFTGLLSLSLGTLLGFVRDETQDYRLCIHLLSLLVLVAMVAWLVEATLRRCRQNS